MSLTITNFRMELACLGITAKVVDGKVKLAGSINRLPPETLAWLRQHKAEIAAMLSTTSDPVKRYLCPTTGAIAFSRWPLDSRYWTLEAQQ
ncbi:MAG: hypothetical protein HKL96_09650 [Phycisphaerales bacterium]|nr:hypothetical protein [Phycisphaerales bacterium]